MPYWEVGVHSITLARIMSSQPDLPEFAEPYTKEDAIRIVVIGTLAGAAVVILGKSWLFPSLKEFATTAPCRAVWGIDGMTVLWYGLFVGLPLLAALLTLATLGWRGYKIFRDGQFPPLKEKVARPTRIRRGRKARLIGYLHLCACLPLLALSVWGYFQAEELLQRPIPASAYKACAAYNGAMQANPSINTDAAQ